ncbi:MAG: ATP-dependent RecD-like DNA helicase [Bacilli bacterium]|nr:ATP-dependent RecD-like DNA helicase [Bacilli bacterium]MDD4053490.1 ATP-dependent RecD-like DNA helicase [Bacilli bacterium]MDD4411525.1 ATP-dependent RecD-like DNA helicase [Bacilli bacterium]
MTYVKGNIKHIIFKSDTGFNVGLFKVLDTDNEEIEVYLNKTIIFTGTFSDLNNKVDYIFHGDLVEHPKYGDQFSVTAYEQIMPESKNGIISFLSSKIFSGVGVKLATSIVDTLGDEALELIDEDYHNLLLVPKMTEKKAIKIQTILKRESASYKIIVNLQTMGFSMNEASNIYKYYKENTMFIIEDNIYAVVNDIEGIGFLTVDRIAFQREIPSDDERRIKACILYIMGELCLNNGNIYNDIEDIYLGVTNYLHIDFSLDDFKLYLSKLELRREIVIEEDRYYLKEYYDSEVYNAHFIRKILKNKNENFDNLDKYIYKLENSFDLKYNEKQQLAIKDSFLKNFLVITGGPGTGKTTIIKAIVGLYREIHKLTIDKASEEIALLAPTGRAAKRITEATGVPAMTIHKFLKWNKETNAFGVNEFNQVDVKFVIVDEVSMVDHYLLTSLFKGLTSNVKIIFVGDYNQLPSVGPGEILKDLIECGHVPVIELNDLYRQKENSYIVEVAYEIKNGVISNDIVSKHDDYNFIETRKNEIKTIVVELCKKALEKGYSYKEIQVLVPMYKGINGIDAMNIMLQDVFNPKTKNSKSFSHNNITYRIGDKVLQIKNNNDLNISNGDIGTIENIIFQNGEEKILVAFNDEIIEYNPKDFDDIRLGYAISIHKSQGSEFDIVILPMDLSYNRMLYRKLIYTAVTRAKKSLMIVGEKEALKRAIINTREQKRKTTLGDRISKL